MDAPSLVDNIADLERLAKSIDQRESLQVPLSILRELPGDIREWGWKASAIMLADDLGGGLLSFKGPKDTCHIGAALDIGTTTLVLSLVDMESGTTISTSSDYNRQSRAGDDIIARITHAEEGGLEELQDLVLRTIDHLLLEARASSERPIAGCDVTALSVAGNTTLVHLFLALDPRWIRYEPYIHVRKVATGERVRIRGGDLPDRQTFSALLATGPS